ncbi:Rrf2 family transcriptional regulator [Xenorhabdus bovienii]|uniref:Rrf2 family transcriptional regulator n=1 Tax=Xenorhabdus bovienii TaxID=40576 RepID=UPI0023B23CFE|nr:Rrf2 family transcriptional regulator [Xenorhabdus bovienii]MDE9588230.1 Rrf2 family transcriptional regulator [Xenorhabdus bovienii]
MKVSIELNGETVWYRDEEKGEGMASTGYIKDGTQQKVITALESALFQAKAEASCWDNHSGAVGA